MEDVQQKLVRLLRQGICEHKRTGGGNDYLTCFDCGYEWDYRKSDAYTQWVKDVREALKGL